MSEIAFEGGGVLKIFNSFLELFDLWKKKEIICAVGRDFERKTQITGRLFFLILNTFKVACYFVSLSWGSFLWNNSSSPCGFLVCF